MVFDKWPSQARFSPFDLFDQVRFPLVVGLMIFDDDEPRAFVSRVQPRSAAGTMSVLFYSGYAQFHFGYILPLAFFVGVVAFHC
jgi:hypothetical protein